MKPAAPPSALWPRIKRLVRHRCWDEADTRRLLPDEALARLEGRVTQSERQHSGEIRLCVEASLPVSYLWQGLSARQRAITLFGKLRVWDTADNNGVLIYLLLAEHAIEIVADRGLNPHVSPAQWQAIIERMRPALQGQGFEQALLEAVESVDSLLRQHFALREGQSNPNELPDTVLMRR